MSLILDALKKSEKERQLGGKDAEAAPPPAPVTEALPETPRRLRWPWVAGGLVVVNAVGLAAFFILRTPESVPVVAPPPEPQETAAKEEATQQALLAAEADAKAKAAAQALAKTKAEARLAAEAKIKAEAEAREKAKVAEAEAKTRKAAKAEAALQAERKALAEAEAREQLKVDARAKAEEEAKKEAKAEAAKKKNKKSRIKVVTASAKPPARTPAKETPGAGALVKRGQAFEQEGLFEKAIEEYTRAILADPKNDDAYFGRGWAHSSLQRHEDAVRNFTQAIEVNPKFADAYFGRGWAYEQQGQIDLAIGDYGQAIKAAPKYADAYFSRGILAFFQGRLGAAAKDFTGVYKNSSGALRDYALIWKYVAETRTGADKGEALALIKGLVSRDGLPGALVAAFAGDAGEQELLAQSRSSNPLKQRENECIAYFFLGQSRLIAGDSQGAADYFRKTLATGVVNFRQYAAAKIELERIEK